MHISEYYILPTSSICLSLAVSLFLGNIYSRLALYTYPPGSSLVQSLDQVSKMTTDDSTLIREVEDAQRYSYRDLSTSTSSDPIRLLEIQATNANGRVDAQLIELSKWLTMVANPLFSFELESILLFSWHRINRGQHHSSSGYRTCRHIRANEH